MIRVVSFAGGVKSPELPRNKNRETPQLFGHIRNSKEEELNDQLLSSSKISEIEEKENENSSGHKSSPRHPDSLAIGFPKEMN